MVREPGPNQVHPTVTVVVPTLAADESLTACLDSLDQQTFSDFEIVVVDNSGRRSVQPRGRVRVIANDRNVGFGAAFNQAFLLSNAPGDDVTQYAAGLLREGRLLIPRAPGTPASCPWPWRAAQSSQRRRPDAR